MTSLTYYALFKTDNREPPVGLMVRESSTGPLRVVLWNHRVKAWTFSPEIAAPILYDDRNFDRREPVDRSTAEQIALTLGTVLPSEPELLRIAEEAEPSLGYHAVFKKGRLTEPATGLIVVEPSQGPLRAVIWSHRQGAWVFNPTAAAPFLFDDQTYDQQTPVSRPTAEQIARTLGTELPSEPELRRIAEEAQPRP